MALPGIAIGGGSPSGGTQTDSQSWGASNWVARYYGATGLGISPTSESPQVRPCMTAIVQQLQHRVRRSHQALTPSI